VGFCTLSQNALIFDLQHKRDRLPIYRIKKALQDRTCLLLALASPNLSRLLFSPPFNLRRSDWPSVFHRAVRERDKCGLGENHHLHLHLGKADPYFSHQPSFSCQGHNSSADRLALIIFFAFYFACILFLQSLLSLDGEILDVLFHRSRGQASTQSREY
jgi:hypothetical protein